MLFYVEHLLLDNDDFTIKIDRFDPGRVGEIKTGDLVVYKLRIFISSDNDGKESMQ